MKNIILLTFIAAMSCAPVPTELPVDFDPEFSF